MDNAEVILEHLRRIEDRVEKSCDKMDKIIEKANAQEVKVAEYAQQIEEHERQIESLENQGDKRRESVGTWIGIATGITALLVTFGKMVYNLYVGGE